jgi:hypothetical protein
MSTVYLIAAIIGIGLLAFSALGVGDAEATVGDTIDIGGADAGEFLLGLLSTRNLTFFLAAFGGSGLILGWLGMSALVTAVVATALGLTAMLMVHGVFTWLKRSDAAVDVLGDRDFEGVLGRVVLPIAPGVRGQVACVIAGREQYLTAMLDDDQSGPLAVGQGVIVLSTESGLARVIPTSPDVLPSST